MDALSSRALLSLCLDGEIDNGTKMLIKQQETKGSAMKSWNVLGPVIVQPVNERGEEIMAS